MKDNLRFNRREHRGKHYYLKDFPAPQQIGHTTYDGYLKCKLVHHEGFSLVLPDQIYLSLANQTYWFQPFYFTANLIGFLENGGICSQWIDLSFGARAQVTFSDAEQINRLSDGSLLYKCRISGPPLLWQHATGTAIIKNCVPYLKVFHHTDRKAEKGILKSGEFWSSKWNIQGTKRLSNIAYLYLTPLDKVVCDNDLQEIAMSIIGQIPLRLDQNLSDHPDEYLRVYRESTENRTRTLPCWVRADHLSPQHVYRHTPLNGAVYFEIVCPFILRLGVESETTIRLNKTTLAPRAPKLLEYVVVGDATSLSGLRAPYDEEHTEHILKIDSPKLGDDIITHWRKYPNANLFDGIVVEKASFEPEIPESVPA